MRYRFFSIFLVTFFFLINGEILRGSCSWNAIQSTEKGESEQQHRPWDIRHTTGDWDYYVDVHPWRFDLILNKQFLLTLENVSIRQAVNQIQSYYREAEILDEIELILLNDEFSLFSILQNDGNHLTRSNEIKFVFNGKEDKLYKVSVKPREFRELNIVYVETSGGNQYLVDLKKDVDQIVEKGVDFLLYFKAPGRGITVTDPSGLSGFYNMVFSSITQPPFAGQELKMMKELQEELFPYDGNEFLVHISFYITELAYNRMEADFLKPFVAYLRELDYIQLSEVNIITDFAVELKEKGFHYKHYLSKP